MLLLGLFVLVQSRVSSPLLPLRILTNRNRAGSFLAIILAVLGMYGTFLFLTYLLQTVDDYSPLKAGVAFLPLMAVNGLSATQLASRLMVYVRTRVLVVPGLLIAALGVALLTQLTPGAPYVSHVLPTELLLGLGLGLAMVPCISTATTNAEPRDVGVTSATTNTSQQIGASVGTALLNTVAATATAAYLATHRHAATEAAATIHGFAVASGWGAASLVLAAVVGGILIDARPAPGSPRPPMPWATPPSPERRADPAKSAGRPVTARPAPIALSGHTDRPGDRWAARPARSRRTRTPATPCSRPG